MPVIRIRSRVGAAALSGAPANLEAGELAYNIAGMNLSDKSLGGSLHIGNGQKVVTLISSQRQVEITGNQDIFGVKTFRDGIRIGKAGQDIGFPTTKGQPGEVLSIDAAGTGTEWRLPHDLKVRSISLTGRHGSVIDNANAHQGGFTINPEELVFLTDTESGERYLWAGSPGTFGSAGGGTQVTGPMLAAVGSVIEIATAADVRAGTPRKVIPADVAAAEIFRLDELSGNQKVTAPTTIFTEKRAGDNNGKVEFNSDITAGRQTDAIQIVARGGSTLKGFDPTELLTIDNAVLDAGTF